MLTNRLIYAALFAAIAFLSAGPAATSVLAAPAADRFPPTGDMDGMSITYEIGGAVLDGPRMPKESELFGYNLPSYHKSLQDQISSGRARWYGGQVTGSRLTVSGTARASGRWADLNVWVEGQKPGNSKSERFEKEVDEGQSYVQSFLVSIELAPDETYARFSILFKSQLGEDNLRFLEVAGDFSVAPPGAPRLTAESEERWLPPDGVSKSRVTFTYLEGERPVSGKTINVSLAPRRGKLDASSVTTDDNGEAVVSFTAPKPEEGHVASVNVTGEAAKPTLIAEVNIQLTPLGIVDLGINSRAEAGWDSIALEAKVQNFHTARLRDIRVVFYAGEGSASGQRLGEQTIPDLMPGEAAWSGGPEADKKFVDWVLFGNAEKARLTVMVLDAKQDAGELDLPPGGVAALRTFTLNNYAAPFVTNVDGYSFVNPGNEVGSPLWLEDQLAAMLAADQQASSGLTILSYSALLQDVAAWAPKDAQGQPVWPGLGHCQGVSATAINYFLYPSDRPAPGPTYLYSFDDPKVRSNIVLQQIYQYSSYYQNKAPWGGSIDPIPARLIDLQKTLKDELGAARPVMLWVKEPGGAGGRDASHAVVAYQMVEVPELDLARLVLYDPNFPHSELMEADGLAKAGSLNVSKQAFSYEAGYHYKEVALMWTPRLPPTSAQAFYDLTRELADSTLRELVGATPQQRLVVYRGSDEPLFVTKDGKQRIGWEADKSGKKKLVNTMRGATVWRFGSYGVYIFKLPANIQVTSSTRVSSTGTITVGVVSPTPARTSLDLLGPGIGQLGIPALAGPEAKAVLFRKVEVQPGAAVDLDLNATGDAALRVSGQAVAPAGQETLTVDQFAPAQGSEAAVSGGLVASPTWMDPLDGQADSGGRSLSISAGNVPSSKVVSWDPGSAGKAAALTTFDSYIGYGGSRLGADKGSILFRWQPAPNLAAVFGRQNYDVGWTDYGDEEPPQWGFLLDTVGWGDAPPGALALILDPTPYGSLNFGVWEGSEGHFATWDVPSSWEWDPERWYEIGVTWGPKGMSLLVDGEVKATVPDVVRVNNQIPWFLGQAPSYWPYGPHTMMGSYDEVRVYGEQLVAYDVARGPLRQGVPGSPVTPLEPRSRDLRYLGGESLGEADAYGGRAPGTPPSAIVKPGKRPGSGPLPTGALADRLPGGSQGSVAKAIYKLPGGAAWLYSLPLLAGAGVLVLAKKGLFTKQRKRRARRSKSA